MPYPDRFYPIVDSVAWLQRLSALGVGTVQLRVKDLEHEAAVGLVRAALAAVRGTLTKLVINDHWRAALEAGAQHVHLGQEDLLEADLKAIRRAQLTLGLSSHDDAELENALRHAPDYIALGPIFETTLKVMRFGPQGIPKIAAWKRRIGTVPLVAIGGITLERAREVYAAGADSISVVSDLTRHDDPDKRVRDWLARASVTQAPASSQGAGRS
jgi:thiamine-phosphate pyrophosphorylase